MQKCLGENLILYSKKSPRAKFTPCKSVFVQKRLCAYLKLHPKVSLRAHLTFARIENFYYLRFLLC